MEIKDPKFKRGDKVIDEYGNIYIVLEIRSYSFINNDYWYGVENDVEKRVMLESKLELYQEPPKTVWDLQNGDECFLLMPEGTILPETWGEVTVQLEYRTFGNCFLTEEEAENELERRKIENEMLRLGGRKKFKKGENCFYIRYDFNTDCVDVDYIMYESYGQGMIYFDSEEKANKVIKEIGASKVKKYIFGVES